MHQVLFYRTTSGNEPVRDFLKSFSKAEKTIIGADLRAVQLGFPMGLPVCGSLGNGLYEVRSSLPSGIEVRLIFFHSRALGALVVLHGFIKKTQKAPLAAVRLAAKRKQEFSP